MNITDKQLRIINIVKSYVTEKLGGEKKVWEWLVSERFDWNGGFVTLKVQVWDPYVLLEVITFKKTTWGIGEHRDGSLAWKFKYTDKDIDGLLTNKEFVEAIQRHVLDNAVDKS